MLIEYWLEEDAGTAFVLGDGDLRAVPLPGGQREAGRLLHLWQMNLESTARALQAGVAVEGLARNARGSCGPSTGCSWSRWPPPWTGGGRCRSSPTA